MKKLFLFGSSLMMAMPLAVFAEYGDVVEGQADPSRIGGIFNLINNILHWVIPVLITVAVIYFIWGVIQYLISGDEEQKKKATGMTTKRLIGLFIIVAFWGIIRFFSDSIGVGPEQLNVDAIPCVPLDAEGSNCVANQIPQ